MIEFAGIKSCDGEKVEFTLGAFAGWDIDHTLRDGQVSLYITGPLEEGGVYETAIDLELPMARTIAAAILALCDWAEQRDAENRRNGLKPDEPAC